MVFVIFFRNSFTYCFYIHCSWNSELSTLELRFIDDHKNYRRDERTGREDDRKRFERTPKQVFIINRRFFRVEKISKDREQDSELTP